MSNHEGFQIPTDFIHRLNEYTHGYLLVVCNEEGEITAYESFDTPVIKLGLLNFTKMHVDAYHKYINKKALKEEEKADLDENEDEDEDDDAQT